MSTPVEAGSAPTSDRWVASYLVVALIVALGAAAGSMWLSVGMDLTPCPLCYYQRTFVFAATGVLLIGALGGPQQRALAMALALPAAVGGLAVAIFHVMLESGGQLECPGGILGLGTAPQQSLLALAPLSLLLGVAAIRSARAGGVARAAPGAAIGLGMVLAGLAIWSAPALPPPPTEPYAAPPIACRPPYQP